MRPWIKRLGLGLLALVLLAGGLAIVKREELTRLLAVNTLFAPDRIVSNFSNMDDLFLSVPLPTEPGPALPVADAVPLPDGADQWIVDRQITGLVVLNDGQITHESYHLGTGPEDLRISWSVAKSFVSLLTGQLVTDGVLTLDDQVVQHAPELAGSAYDGASIRDVLQMESGVAFNEDYFDKSSDINRMGRVIALGGALDDFTADLTNRRGTAGDAWQYVSMDTHVIGMVLRGATNRSLTNLMAEKLLSPMGIGPARFLTDGDGVAFALGGLNMRTVDYARMGLLVEQGGILNGRQIVPTAWIDESTAPSAHTAEGKIQYGYQWWIPADARDGEVMAQGVYGQFVYIDRANGVVIAVNSADLSFRAPGVRDGMVDMFRAIAAAQP